MTSKVEFVSKSGKHVEIVADYRAKMVSNNVSLDSYKVMIAGELDDSDSVLRVYVDGELLDESNIPGFWRVIDDHKIGHKRIWGIEKMAFADDEIAEQYDAWIKSLIEAGKPEELKAAEVKAAAEEKAAEIEYAKETIAKAEAQKDIPSREEAKRRMNAYNNVANEGGYGYVPHWVSREEYEAAKALLTR